MICESQQDRIKDQLLQLQREPTAQQQMSSRAQRRISRMFPLDLNNLTDWSEKSPKSLSCSKSVQATKTKVGFQLPRLELADNSEDYRYNVGRLSSYHSVDFKRKELRWQMDLNQEIHNIESWRAGINKHQKGSAKVKTVNLVLQKNFEKPASPRHRPQPLPRPEKPVKLKNTCLICGSRHVRNTICPQQMDIYLHPAFIRQLLALHNNKPASHRPGRGQDQQSKFSSIRYAHKQNVKLGRSQPKHLK